ncbi:glycine cleavage T C-terminal barrel domain-containing protein, partial [Georgenia sp. 10Sc9-8]|nr:glycine cleavage T C-terminal barrel domain-containing protein [Georgenia halotolerans]
LRYYAIVSTAVAGVPVLLARTGYTGEDGFELSVPAASAVELWGALEVAGGPEVAPCGLACRDSLRLEAGMPLYGNELSRSVTPYETGAGRVVHLDHDFVGRAALARRHEEPSGTVLAGLVGEGRRAARPGCTVHDGDREVGTVTSGMLSPTSGHPVALALMESSLAVAGARLEVDVRGTRQPVTVVDPPFYRRPDATRPTGRETTRPAHEEHP